VNILCGPNLYFFLKVLLTSALPMMVPLLKIYWSSILKSTRPFTSDPKLASVFVSTGAYIVAVFPNKATNAINNEFFNIFFIILLYVED